LLLYCRGRAAEELVFNEMTSVHPNDIEQATTRCTSHGNRLWYEPFRPVNLGPQYDSDEFGKTTWYEPSSVSPAMAGKS